MLLFQMQNDLCPGILNLSFAFTIFDSSIFPLISEFNFSSLLIYRFWFLTRKVCVHNIWNIVYCSQARVRNNASLTLTVSSTKTDTDSE